MSHPASETEPSRNGPGAGRGPGRTGATFLSLSTSPWTYPYWTSRQFLMHELAQLVDVAYATARHEWRSLVKNRLTSIVDPAPFPAPPRLRLLRPRWPRVYRYTGLDKLCNRGYLRRLQRQLDSGKTRIVYVWEPEFAETVGHLSCDAVIYHPYDMFRHFWDASKDVVEQETELCRLADAVVTPHSRIAEALGHPNSHVINNGVFLPAFPHFSTVTPDGDIANLMRPVIGYVGTINQKVDFELLSDVFSRRPEWQLVLVGIGGAGAWKETPAYQALRALRNVHLLPPVPIDRVASVIAGFDVGIIPYSLTGWARFSESPLKLYQYWAMGVPVVSSALPTLESKPGVLEVCGTSEEWTAAIERQLAVSKHDARAELRKMAESHSWASKARQVVEVVENCLA
jgi:glycosyltransferase involved in cell wall biosynthesis